MDLNRRSLSNELKPLSDEPGRSTPDLHLGNGAGLQVTTLTSEPETLSLSDPSQPQPQLSSALQCRVSETIDSDPIEICSLLRQTVDLILGFGILNISQLVNRELLKPSKAETECLTPEPSTSLLQSGGAGN